MFKKAMTVERLDEFDSAKPEKMGGNGMLNLALLLLSGSEGSLEEGIIITSLQVSEAEL